MSRPLDLLCHWHSQVISLICWCHFKNSAQWFLEWPDQFAKAPTVGENFLWRILFCSNPPQHPFVVYFVDLVHSDWVRWNCEVVFIWLSIIAKNDKQYEVSQSSIQKTRWLTGLRNKNQETHLNAKHIHILN